MSGEEAHTIAVVAKLNAAGANAYSLSDLEKYKTTNSSSMPTTYTEVHVMERLPQNLRMDGTTATRYYTILCRSVGKLYVNAQRERERARTALLWQFMTVEGVETSAISMAIAPDPIGPDDGWHSGVSEYQYSH